MHQPFFMRPIWLWRGSVRFVSPLTVVYQVTCALGAVQEEVKNVQKHLVVGHQCLADLIRAETFIGRVAKEWVTSWNESQLLISPPMREPVTLAGRRIARTKDMSRCPLGRAPPYCWWQGPVAPGKQTIVCRVFSRRPLL